VFLAASPRVCPSLPTAPIPRPASPSLAPVDLHAGRDAMNRGTSPLSQATGRRSRVGACKRARPRRAADRCGGSRGVPRADLGC